MTDHGFPAASYAEALPALRAPFTSDLVNAIVVNTPQNPAAPCKVWLYVTSETVMSRLNIVCGLNWGVRFEKLTERSIPTVPTTMGFMQRLGLWLRRRLGFPIANVETSRYYVQVRAHVTVFGRPFEDLGEGTADTAAMAEYKARAQSLKRAVRWVEVGHCLYAADEIVMWRGNGDKQLRIPAKGENAHMRPFQDERSEHHVRARYEHWLEHRGKRIYGEPLDHLQAAGARGEVTQPQSLPDDRHPHQALPSDRQDTVHALQVPAPGMIVNAEIVQSASDAGFGESVARHMTRLARGEEQVGALTQPQTRTVQGWITDLSSLGVKEPQVLRAIDLALERSADRDGARTTFAGWIDTRTHTPQPALLAVGGGQAAARPAPVTASNDVQGPPAPDGPVTQPGTRPAPAAPAVQAAPNGQPVSAIFPSGAPDGAGEEDSGTAHSADSPEPPAVDGLAQASARYGYQQSVVHCLVALAEGQGPQRQLPWESLREETVREITRLLGCAATLGWDNARLQRMVMRAHNSARQSTPAGRYATFASHLTNAANDHAAETARAAA